ncbi:MAG: hypothetical protein P8Y70_16140 [Candidatus Lokiarchaeota archaeon]
MAKCPECAGNMKFNPKTKSLVCQSCGLSLQRHELENYWSKIKNDNIDDLDESSRRKQRRKDWLDWYASSKEDKERY